jgi:hypothetical protein
MAGTFAGGDEAEQWLVEQRCFACADYARSKFITGSPSLERCGSH